MRELVVCLLCLAILAPRAASALDPGAIEARSAQYEPLDARIALHDVRAGDTGEIKVTLGSRSQFEIAGVARPFHLTLIEFTVVEQEDGLAYIQLRTDVPIIEPFLTFLINVDWPRGHAIRGYNLKLSSPARGTTGASVSRRTAPEGEREPEAAPATPAPSGPGGIPGAASSGEASPAPEIRTADAAVPGSPPPASSHTADGDAYGPVRPTDTLWAIALRFRPDDSISAQRMMLALVEANPQAFDLRNVNGLNAGVILRIPTRDEIGLDDRAAIAEVRRQNLAWKQNRENLRTAPPRAVPAPDVPVSAAPSAGSTPPAPAPAPPSPDTGAQPGGRLEVVSPGTAPGAAAPEEETDVQALRDELALAMEAADAKHLENEEITSRLVEAEKRIEDLYRLVTLKDDEIAALEAELRAAAEAEPAPPRTLPDTPPPEAEKSIIGAVVGRLPFGPDTLAISPVFLVGAAGALLLLLGVVALRRRRRVPDGEDEALDPPAVPSAQWNRPATAAGTGDPGDMTSPSDRSAAYALPVASMETVDASRSGTGGLAGRMPELPDENEAGHGRIVETGAGADAGDGVPGVVVGRDAPAGRGSATAAPDSAVKARDDETGGDSDFSIGGLTDSEAGVKADPASPADGAAGGFHPDRPEAPAADSRASAGAPAAGAGDLPDPGSGVPGTGPERKLPAAPASGVAADLGAGTADGDIDAPDTADPDADRTFVPVTDEGVDLDPGVDRGGSGESMDILPMQPDDGSVDEDETEVFAPDGSGGDIVQTKIDLAQVYMEMGDAENARLFLGQALSEGNADQRETARAMLSKLA